MKNKIFKRITSAVLTVAIVISGLVGFSLSTAADMQITKLTDPSTMDNWKLYYGAGVNNTSMAGGVWTDKSVFTDASEFAESLGITMRDPNSNFLIALSAIASNKSMTGYSNVPTDTMLVLDISGSMSEENVEAMVQSTNDAIKRLQEVNYYNRVGVVLYSGSSTFSNSSTDTATVLLPLGRYSQADDNYVVLTSSSAISQNNAPGGNNGPGGNNRPGGNNNNNNNNNNNDDGLHVAVNPSVKNENNASVGAVSKKVVGGTYVQNGIYKAMQELLSVDDTTIEDGFQAGTKRIPILVLMSDGAPTVATSSYNNVSTSNIGNGSETTNDMVFLTQLTCAYAKAKISEHYDNSALFYTLGLGVGSNQNALATLDPEESNNNIKNDWASFLRLSENRTLALSSSIAVRRDMTVTQDYQYYSNQYFQASNAAGLINAFESIVEQIIIQSLYYPTHISGAGSNLSGYLRFHDDLGKYMDVVDIKGVVLGEALFSGSMLARNFVLGGGALGTTDAPTELGDEFINSVRVRLGIDDVEDARELVAYAFEYKQLYYASDSDFSNYIGWYANDAGEYLGFWCEEHTEKDYPAGATYINKSYGLLGEVSDGVKSTDMMYASIQVHKSIATGDVSLIWAIPAALIPVISYKISFEGSSIEDARNVVVEITEESPIRLVYEVGLRSDITPINIREIVGEDYEYINSDGSYTFYTNKWDVEAFESEIHYSQDVNTVSYFEPNAQNERFYYTENSDIYVKNGNEYVKFNYNGNALPDGEYYRLHAVFHIDDAATGAASLEHHYDRIYAEGLSKAQKDENGNWYIPKGTILPSVRLNRAEKTDNVTDTLEYSGYPTVELAYTDGEVDHYYVDAVLGNNGKLTVIPATGLKITKKLTAAVPDTSTNFTFNIKSSNTSDNSTYPTLFVYEDGREMSGYISFVGGEASFMLRPEQSLFIVDLPENVSYTISETKNDAYTIDTINGQNVDQITVSMQRNAITDIEFTNKPRGAGQLFVSKTVEHPFESSWAAHLDKEFTFEVDLGSGSGGKSYELSLSNRTSNVTADANGKFTITLKHGETALIADIPDGTEVTVREISIPDGFQAKETTLSAVIGTDENTVLNFTNVYSPTAPTDVNVTLTGRKVLTGRDWLDSDEFTVILQRLDGSVWTNVAQKALTKDERDYDFTSALKAETYENAGVYQYRIYEADGNIGGVSYDRAYRHFSIVVHDADADGSLEITSVTQGTGARVEYALGVWNVYANFGNVYAPTGDTTVTVNITKKVSNTTSTNISLSGFVFALYNQGQLVTTSAPTDENGLTSIELTFLANEVDSTLIYSLREVTPDSPIPGLIYTDKAYTLIVDVIDDLDGTVSATISELGANAAPSDSFAAEFTNVYDPDEVDITINGSKALLGREMTSGEFEFELYEIIGGIEVLKDSAVNGETGYFAFGTLVYETTGSYRYSVKEKATDASNVSYDERVFYIDVTITDENGILVESVVITDEEGNACERITFTNVYTPDPTDITISGNKTLVGRELGADEFTFAIYNADSSFTVHGTPLLTATNDADGLFTFDKIYFDQAGTYYFVVSEDATASLGGISYDTRSYRVTVTVTDDGKGTLTANVEYADQQNLSTDAISFTNVYSASSTYVTIGGEKKLTGRELLIGEFKFDVYSAEGEGGSYVKTAALVRSAENNADGSFIFEPITFDAAGVYKFVIIEDSSDKEERITYDESVYELTVVVEDNGAGALVASYTIAKQGETDTADLVFNNVYTPRPDDITLDIKIKKTVNNIGELTIGPNGFEFELAGSGIEEAIKLTTDANGDAVYTLTYTEDDIGKTYVYTVSEKAGDDPYVTYDDTIYTIELTIGLDENNKLTADAKIDGVDTDEILCEFVNTYEFKAPYTGDGESLALWIGTFALCATALFVLCTAKKRKAN